MKPQKLKTIKLTNDEIQNLIDELNRVPHNIWDYLDYGKLVNKLRNALGRRR